MLISICLPAYNGQEFIAAAIESVLSQTHGQFELLIADDCSTDGTYEIVQKYARDNNKIISWQNEKRLGLFANYNRCLEQARGELIKPFAQDDELKPTALSRMAEVFAATPELALVACAKEQGHLYAARIEHEAERLPQGRVQGKEAILQCLSTQRNLIGEPVSVMFPARLKGTGFDTGYHSLGDLDYWFRLIEQGDLHYLSEELVTFRQHPGSSTSELLRNMDWVLDFFQLSKTYEKYLSELGSNRDQFCLRFVESAGTLIDQLSKAGKLEVGDLSGYREVAYFAMRRCAELGCKSREYDSVVQSTSWRITEPLRSLVKMFGGDSR
ncbi:MAG: glycosyltransferase family 2 protein [Terriglobales bacterium]